MIEVRQTQESGTGLCKAVLDVRKVSAYVAA